MSSDSAPTRLSAALKLSPSSSKRRPLQQLTNFDANTPSIRIVEDSAYTKSPFPTLPSQILQPRYAPFGQPFGNKGHRVSDENTPTNGASAKINKGEALVPLPLQPRKSNRASTSTNASDLDTSFSSGPFSPTSSRISSETSPPSSPVEEYHDSHETRLSPVHEHLAPINSTSRSTIRAVIPSASNDRLPSKQSKTSLASSVSSDLPSAHNRKDRRRSSASSTNFVVFPHSSSITLPADTGANKDVASSPPARSIPNYSSVESLAFSDASYSSNAERPRSASSPPAPSHAGLRAAFISGAKIQYPAIRTSSATASRADVSRPTSKPSSRMPDGPIRPPPWSSRLSTIASESTDRTSQSTSSAGIYNPKRRRTLGSSDVYLGPSSPSEGSSSIFEEGSGVLTGSESNVSIPYPPALFAPISSRPLPPTPKNDGDAPGRDSDERNDTLGELQPPAPLRSQRSGLLSRFRPASSRPSSSDSNLSHISQISFIGDLSWAKRYYSNGEPANLVARSLVDLSNSDSGSSARLNTGTSGTTSSPVSDNFPNTLWRPRTRPHQGRAPRSPRAHRARHSMAITEVSETDSADRRRRRSVSLSVTAMTFSPHLGRDRRATARYRWGAPSMEEPFGKGLFGPTNRQVFLFCLGFLCPLAWILAAFLPLPKRPPTYSNPDNTPSTAQVSEYGTRGYPHSVVPSEMTVVEKRWHKAYWWRTLNRVLSVVGLLIIGAVVALAVVGTRMRRQQIIARGTTS